MHKFTLSLKCCERTRSMCMCSAPFVLWSALHLSTASTASCSSERQPSGWLLVEVETYVRSVIYLVTETLFDLKQVTFFSSCFVSPHAVWECIMYSYPVGILICYCSDKCLWTVGKGRKHTQRGRKMAEWECGDGTGQKPCLPLKRSAEGLEGTRQYTNHGTLLQCLAAIPPKEVLAAFFKKIGNWEHQIQHETLHQ